MTAPRIPAADAGRVTRWLADSELAALLPAAVRGARRLDRLAAPAGLPSPESSAYVAGWRWGLVCGATAAAVVLLVAYGVTR